jgi:transposase
MRARHRLSKLLMRHGSVYYDDAAWTDRHDRWLRREAFGRLPMPSTLAAFDAHYEAVLAVTARRDRLDAQIDQLPPGRSSPRWCAGWPVGPGSAP